MAHDFSNIELSLGQKLVLHLIPLFKLEVLFPKKTVRILKQHGFVRRKNGRNFSLLCRTDSGAMYFRVKRKGFWRFAIPTIISIVALLAAYDVMYIQPLSSALQAIASLLKTTLENLGAALQRFF